VNRQELVDVEPKKVAEPGRGLGVAVELRVVSLAVGLPAMHKLQQCA